MKPDWSCFLISLFIVIFFAGQALSYDEPWYRTASKSFHGMTLNGIAENSAISHYIEKNIGKEFHRITGIHIDIEKVPWEMMYQKSLRDYIMDVKVQISACGREVTRAAESNRKREKADVRNVENKHGGSWPAVGSVCGHDRCTANRSDCQRQLGGIRSVDVFRACHPQTCRLTLEPLPVAVR